MLMSYLILFKEYNMAPRTNRKSKAPGKRRGKKGGRSKRSSNVPDRASLSVKRSLAVSPSQPGYATNTLYSLMNTQLLDYQRAVTVASAYQHYRIKKVSLTFKPSSDTFMVTQATKPNLYHMIDKSGSVPTNITLEGLKQMGARPKQLDEKNLVVQWSPSVLESVMYASGGVGAASSSKYKISPWLTTTADNVSPGAFVPNAVDHLGIYWYVDQALTQGYQYTVECEVQFEFKKPLASGFIGTTHATPAIVATLNDSPDGIVGGGDGI